MHVIELITARYEMYMPDISTWIRRMGRERDRGTVDDGSQVTSRCMKQKP